MNKKLTLICLTISCTTALAEQETHEFAPFVVTATRTKQLVNIASTTVITQDDIERLRPMSVQEVLRGIPGLSISNSGGLGKSTSIYIRGTEADHVLVLIDGVRMGSVTLGTTAFQDIPIDQVERIEVVRGPRSSLYGSEAIGGVIQIFTRKGKGQKIRPTFSVQGGTHNTYKVSGGVSGSLDDSWFNFRGSHQETEGFNACQGSFSGGCFTQEPDRDGYRNSSGSVRLGHRFNNGLELEAGLLHIEGDNEFDGTMFGGNTADIVQQAVSGSAKYSPIDNWDISVVAGRTLDKSNFYYAGDFIDKFDSERISVNWQNDYHLSSTQLITAGVDFYQDSVVSSVQYAKDSRYNIAGFTQYQARYQKHDLQMAVRYDENEQFGDSVTGNIGWGYQLNQNLRMTSSWGSAFKAPTFNELYFPGFGNPDLSPEKSWTAEVGFSGHHFMIDWSVTGYYTDVEQLISFDAVKFIPVNIEKARMAGFELTAKKQIYGWNIVTNFSYIDHENRGQGSYRGNQLARRPREMFQLHLDKTFGRYSVGTSVNLSGSRYDDLANNNKLDGFVTVNIRAEVELYDKLFFGGRINNLFGERYQTARYFNQDRTNLQLNLSYRP